MPRQRVIVVQRGSEYIHALQDYYERGERCAAEDGVTFTNDLNWAQQSALSKKPFVLITHHRPDIRGQDACELAETLKRECGKYLRAFFVYSISPVENFDFVDGWIKKEVASDNGFNEICAIIADLADGMEMEQLFQKYPIAHASVHV